MSLENQTNYEPWMGNQNPTGKHAGKKLFQTIVQNSEGENTGA